MKVFGNIFLYVLITAPWLGDFEQAKQVAKEENKVILLNFSGSDWCAPCIKMKKEIFETKEFEDFASQELVLLKADFPRHKKNQLAASQKAHNEKLAEQFNPSGKFPLTLLLDADGKVIYQWEGYPNMPVEAFIKEIATKNHGR